MVGKVKNYFVCNIHGEKIVKLTSSNFAQVERVNEKGQNSRESGYFYKHERTNGLCLGNKN